MSKVTVYPIHGREPLVFEDAVVTIGDSTIQVKQRDVKGRVTTVRLFQCRKVEKVESSQ